MNQVRATKFYKALEAYKDHAIAEWNECIFTRSDQLTDVPVQKSSTLGPVAVAKRLNNFLSRLLTLENANLTTVVRKNVYAKVTSLLNLEQTNDGTEQPLSGCPLELEDHLGNMSLVEGEDTGTISSSISVPVLDQSQLVAESSLQEILSYLCCMFTSNTPENITEPYAIVDNLLPMLVFCKWTKKSQDRSGVSYISLLQRSCGAVIGLKERRVTVSGPYRSTLWHTDSTPNSSPSNATSQSTDTGVNSLKHHTTCLSRLVKQHLSGSHPNAKPTVSMHSYAEYELQQSNSQLLDCDDEKVSLTSVTVSFTCNKVRKILSAEKQYIDDVKLHVTPLPGDMRSSAFFLYKAVQILEGFYCAFGKSGEVKWSSIDDGTSEESSDSKPKLTTVERIRKVIESYNQEWMVWHKARKDTSKTDTEEDQNESTTDDQNAASRRMIFPREELDFTERIWEELQYVRSCQELIQCFQVILKEIMDGSPTRFWLHRNNNTSLAKIIKESYKGAVTSSIKLSDANCIRLLVEIGLDKLSRDYNNFFITNRLASVGRLEAYFEDFKSVSEFEQVAVSTLQRRFIMLKKLHHVVQLVVQCKQFLSLSDERTFSVTNTALCEYVTEELNFKKTFVFPIDYSEIQNLVEDMLPTIWRLKLSSKQNSIEKTTNHTWMTEYPFHGIMSPPSQDIESMSTPAARATSTSSIAFDMAMKYYVATQTTSVYEF